eukprot:Opistho-1_new@43424
MVLRKKIVIIGDGACGKTCLLVVFKNGGWSEELSRYVPTVFDNFVASLDVNGQHMDLLLWDTAGQDDYDRLRQLSYPETDVVLVCYSIDNPTSFSNVTEKWLPEIQTFIPTVPRILVGLKNDLRNDPVAIARVKADQQEMITESQGKELATAVSAIDFVECSSLLNHNVESVFHKAALATLPSKGATKKKKKGCALM